MRVSHPGIVVPTLDVRAWKVPRCRTGRKLSASCTSTASSVSHCCICRPPVVVGCLLPNFPTCVGVRSWASCPMWLCQSPLQSCWRRRPGHWRFELKASRHSPSIFHASSRTAAPFETSGKYVASKWYLVFATSISIMEALPPLCCLAETFRLLPRQLYARATHDCGAITHNQQKTLPWPHLHCGCASSFPPEGGANPPTTAHPHVDVS